MKEACLTGPNNFGTALHRYLAYPMKCGVTGTPYTVYCYMGKQVRDNSNNSGPVLVFYQFCRTRVRARSTTAASSLFCPARRCINHRNCHDW
jgi:hypothetical protein